MLKKCGFKLVLLGFKGKLKKNLSSHFIMGKCYGINLVIITT